MHAITEINIDGERYLCDLVQDLMRIKVGFKTKNFMTINKIKMEEYFEDVNSFSNVPLRELKRIDDKIGYTYNRNVYE